MKCETIKNSNLCMTITRCMNLESSSSRLSHTTLPERRQSLRVKVKMITVTDLSFQLLTYLLIFHVRRKRPGL